MRLTYVGEDQQAVEARRSGEMEFPDLVIGFAPQAKLNRQGASIPLVSRIREADTERDARKNT